MRCGRAGSALVAADREVLSGERLGDAHARGGDDVYPLARNDCKMTCGEFRISGGRPQDAGTGDGVDCARETRSAKVYSCASTLSTARLPRTHRRPAVSERILMTVASDESGLQPQS